MCATFRIFSSRQANQMASVNKWQSGNLVELADNAFPLLAMMEVERSPSNDTFGSLNGTSVPHVGITLWV